MLGKKSKIGLLFVFLGFFFLLNSMNVINYGLGAFIKDLFPIAIIIVGIMLIIRKKKQEDDMKVHAKFNSDSRFEESGANKTSYEKTFSSSSSSSTTESSKNGKRKYERFLGDLKIDCDGKSIENLDISFFLGDLRLKLHGGIMSKGLNRIVISGFLGEIKVFIPKDFPYFVQASNFLGTINIDGEKSSSVGNSLESQSQNYIDAESKLYISINSFLSDIKVTSD